MKYGYIGSMEAKPGRRQEVVSILLSGTDSLREVGCELYIVNVSNTDQDAIWVFEVWKTKELHDASLQLPESQAAISKVMPMLTGKFTSQEVTVVGGLNL